MTSDPNAIFLVQPPFDFSSMNSDRKSRARGGYYVYYPPLGLCWMAAVLRQKGWRAAVCDAFIEGLGTEGVVRRVAEEKPLVVGVSVTTPTLAVCRGLVGRLKTMRSELGLGFRIVAGGPHVSVDADIAFPMGADYGLAGEADEAMELFCRFVREGERDPAAVPGLIYEDEAGRHHGWPAKADDLDALPHPARDLTPGDRYYNPFVAARTTSFLSTRGCPYTCRFCARSSAMGAWRPRKLDGVLDELTAVERDGCGFVVFVDETFSYDRERALELCRRKREAGMAFRWSCQTRGDAVDREVLEAMREAGCVNVSFGVEAGSKSVRRAMGKGLAAERYLEAFRLCRDVGVTTNAFMQIGSPGEGEEEVEESVRFVFRLDPDYVTYNVATVFPGTGLYEDWLREGKIDAGLWRRCMIDGVEIPTASEALSREQLFRLLRRAYARFYVRPAYVARRLRELTSLREFGRLLRQARTLIFSYVYS